MNIKEIARFFTCFGLLIFILSVPLVLAHGEEKKIESESSFIVSPLLLIEITSIWVVLLTIMVIFKKKGLSEVNKKWFFWLLISPIGVTSIYLIGFTIYENLSSVSGGPVHWHADYQVNVCGEKADLVDPKAFIGKVGSSLFHEHNDGRIHVEGTIRDLESITLSEYFEVVGGELEENHLIYKTNKGIIEATNGDICENELNGTLKVYVNGKRISDFEEYVIYPDSNVPPGDCIIVLFDETDSNKTNILCATWEVEGWNYENFKRRIVTIGGRTWQ